MVFSQDICNPNGIPKPVEIKDGKIEFALFEEL